MHVDHGLLLIVCVQTSGWTAIFFAIEKNNLEIIELLIKGGAKLDVKDKVRVSHSLSLSPVFYHTSIFYSLEWIDNI